MTPNVEALLVPFDSGLHRLRMGAGPERLAAAGAFSKLSRAPIVQTMPSLPGHLAEISSAFEIQRWLAEEVSAARVRGALPLVLAGNCMVAAGVYAGLCSRSRRMPGVCWFDAHGDFNTPETTESGFLDGMALATLTGRCWRSLTRRIPDFRPAADQSVVMIGTRNLDGAERHALESSAINWPRSPAENYLAETKLDVLRDRFGEVYLHIDLDVLDESEGRANGFACAGGLTRQQLLDTVRDIGGQFHIGAASITAYDPACDPEGHIPPIVRDLVATIVGSMH